MEKRPGATISVTRILQDNAVVIDITDNGPGIPENIRSKVFDPFFTTKPTSKGIGLGLALSTRLLLGMGGKLVLARTGELGTTFRIWMPLLKLTKLPQNDSPFENELSFSYGDICALVVDDESGIRELAIDILKDFGLSNIFEAENGAEALKIIKREKLDLILTDMKMPVMGGLELIKAINDLTLSPKPHIALVTGGAAPTLEKEVRDELKKLMGSYVQKPFEKSDIEPVLKAVVAKMESAGSSSEV